MFWHLESVPSGLAWGVEAAITRGVKGVEEAIRGDIAVAALEGSGADGRENTKV